MPKQVTNNEILDAIKHNSKRLDSMDNAILDVLETVSAFSSSVDKEFAQIRSEMVTKKDLDDRLAKQETRLVTKDYLDTKLHDLRGDIISVLRKEDDKVNRLVKATRSTKAISTADTKTILSMGPFARPTK